MTGPDNPIDIFLINDEDNYEIKINILKHFLVIDFAVAFLLLQ